MKDFSENREIAIGQEMERDEQRDMQDPVFLPESDGTSAVIVHRLVIKSLLQDNGDIRKILPDDMPVDSYWDYLGAACGFYKRAEAASQRMRKAVARMLDMASRNPQYHKARGHEKFGDFVESLRDYGLAPAVSHQALQIYRAFPSLPASDWEPTGIGVKKLEMLSGWTNETMIDVKKHIEFAREHTQSELEGYAEQNGFKTRGELVHCIITLPATVEQRDIWEEWKNDGKNQSVCGTKKPGEMLVHALHEAASTWGSHPLPVLVLNPTIRDIIEQFTENPKVQKAAGTSDRSMLVAWALAKCLEGIK